MGENSVKLRERNQFCAAKNDQVPGCNTQVKLWGSFSPARRTSWAAARSPGKTLAEKRKD